MSNHDIQKLKLLSTPCRDMRLTFLSEVVLVAVQNVIMRNASQSSAWTCVSPCHAHIKAYSCVLHINQRNGHCYTETCERGSC
jgi:hypothetical protein